MKLFVKNERMVKASTKASTLNASTRGSICLWVRIYKENTHFRYSQSSSKIYCRCGFANATFLIGYRDGFCHGIKTVRF